MAKDARKILGDYSLVSEIKIKQDNINNKLIYLSP